MENEFEYHAHCAHFSMSKREKMCNVGSKWTPKKRFDFFVHRPTCINSVCASRLCHHVRGVTMAVLHDVIKRMMAGIGFISHRGIL